MTGAGSTQGEPRCKAAAFHQEELEAPGQGQCMVSESLELLEHGQRKGFGLRKEWSVLQGKGTLEERQSQQKGVGSEELEG